MKIWKNPEVWELGVEKTASCIGTKGNDQWLPDRFENLLEHILGIEIGEKS